MISICTNFHVIDFIFNKVIEIINLGVWEQLSILKIAFGAFNSLGPIPILFCISNCVVVQIFMLLTQCAQDHRFRGHSYYTIM